MTAESPLQHRETMIVEQWDDGSTVSEIAERLKMPDNRVYHILRQALIVILREDDLPRLHREAEPQGRDGEPPEIGSWWLHHGNERWFVNGILPDGRICILRGSKELIAWPDYFFENFKPETVEGRDGEDTRRFTLSMQPGMRRRAILGCLWFGFTSPWSAPMELDHQSYLMHLFRNMVALSRWLLHLEDESDIAFELGLNNPWRWRYTRRAACEPKENTSSSARGEHQ